MGNNFISVIIVSWNGKKWLKECLDFLCAQTYKNFEIIFVDNGSTDESQDFIKKNYPEVKIVQNKENLGFGVANNIGVKKSSGDLLFFLNNDTKFSSDLLEKLVAFKNKTDFNIVGPRILNMFGEDFLDGKYLQIDVVGSPGGPSKKLFYIEGCALMINKSDFERLGGFDEKYFMYSEELDLCWRAYIYGMKIAICENARLIHYGGGSSQKTQAEKEVRHETSFNRRLWAESHNFRNLLKNYSVVNLLWTTPLFFVQNVGESLVYLFTGNFKMFAVIWKAFFWNIQNISDTIDKRRIIQKNRKTSDREILSHMYKGFYKWRAFRIVGMPKFK